MWPALLVAAAAGSGFLAKKIFNPNATEPISSATENNIKCDKPNDPEVFTTPFQHKDSSFISKCDENSSFEGFTTPFQHKDSSFTSNHEVNSKCEGFKTCFQQKDSSFEGLSDLSVFKFSSTCGSEMGFRNLRKKKGEGFRKPKGNVKCGKLRIKCRNIGSGEKELSGKRFYVCLKKRKTNKVPSGKCDSCASSGNSVFGWGLGLGMMCMMSAGKSEINRLNTTMNETAKAVEELKAELSRRKNAHDLHTSNNKAETYEKSIRKCTSSAFVASSNGNRNTCRALVVAEDGEYASSVLTEEQQPEVMEMDQLEAELESELQKLPWCATEVTDVDGGRDCKNGFLEKDFNQFDDHNAETYQLSGVLPSELNQKLCQLLIEQQESQIVELQSELDQTHSKLHEKEAELQALKDCVRRLTEFSLGSASDEESDGKMEDEMSSGGDEEKKVGLEYMKSIVGMKRSMNF